MTGFVSVEFATSEEGLAQEAIAKLVSLMEEKGYAGWAYTESDMEIILIGVLAGLALTAAQIASVVPPAVFRQFGTELLKLPFNEGAAATVTTKWTIAPASGIRQIPANTQVEIDSKGFYVEAETEVPSLATSVNIQVAALERGTEYNGLTGEAAQVNPIDFVTKIEAIGESSGGTEEESNEQYQNRLVSELQLQAPRPITAENYAAFVLDEPSTVVPASQEVGRATSIDGYKFEENSFEGQIKTGELKEIQEVTSFTGITKGTELTDEAGVIPPGTVVESFNTSTKKIVMSASATALHAKEKMKAIGSFENERYVTTFVTKKNGEALTSEAMKDIEEYLAKYREINFKAIVRAPTYTEIFCTIKVHVTKGYEASNIEADIKTALLSFLSPEKWGNPTASETGSTQWENYVNGVHVYGTVRYNQIIGVIESVPGVSYVFFGSEGLKIGTTSSPSGTSDIVMKGAAPLPETKLANIVITTG